ncbi:anaerobic ribonucleoside-triphosphate reductase activating protein [Desulfocapsa sp. AH-315-G09]|nr:anaerobic ribonucleoside-triphosphate reductase activating protein [Desulfocapsa sp.]MBN4048765.1 anaerobic ribonucleoside-triphosphate reductase activating protein [bacterium AH-315-N22]MBN4065497.1 anaerobic ribonucleoside-triphosphate reductase activating protein [Desulfocapsa sp. AH-315-G09]
MLIGGIQKFTLSDFPGIPAAIVFTQGCNFRCPFCHNGSLLPMQNTEHISADKVLDWIYRKRGKLTGVVISGGEPTLQHDLLDFIKQIRPMGYQIKLDTNGSKPSLIRELLELQLLDFVAMDIKAPWHKYEQLCGVEIIPETIQKSIAIIATSGVRHTFRTTVVPELLTPEDITEIKSSLPATSPYITQKFIKELAVI